MPLLITKILSASSNTSFNFLDTEHVWGKSTSYTYSFSILDSSFEDGTDSLLEGIEALQFAYSKKVIAAKIGVDEIRNGRITSLSLPESARVGSTTASITIEEFTKTEDDNVLSEIADNVPSPQNVDSFTENYSFQRGEDSYSYNRSVNLKYGKDEGGDFLNKAYLFLKNTYLTNRPNFSYEIDGISEKGRVDRRLKPLITESYDQINKEVSLTEAFSSSRIEDDNGIVFSKKSTFSNALGKNGYTDKNYSIEINALQEPLETVVASGVKLCLDELLVENTGFGRPFKIEKTINSDGGLASLSVAFSNDPRKNQITNIEYSASKNEGGEFDEYSFETSISSQGPNREVAFQTSKDYLLDNSDAPLLKIPALFDITSGNLNEKSRSVSFNPFEKSINASFAYTLDPSYRYEGDGILKRKISVDETKQLDRSQVVPIYGDKEIIINNPAKTLGQKTVSVDIVSLNESRSLEGLQLASGELPASSYYYMKDKKSSETPAENSAKSSISFDFFD